MRKFNAVLHHRAYMGIARDADVALPGCKLKELETLTDA